MMTERQRRFREQYVAGISPWYNGLLHGQRGTPEVLQRWIAQRDGTAPAG